MAANLVLRLTGGASNADPAASLGGTRSGNAPSGTPKNNLFPNATWEQTVTGHTDYRALDILNMGDEAAVDVTAWFTGDTTSEDTTLSLGADQLESSLSIPDQTTAPAGIVFSDPREGSRLNLPDIPAGQGVRLWFKRVVSAGAQNEPNDAATLNWEYA